MGHYYHALPVNGGLQVPAENLEELIAEINEAYVGDACPNLGRPNELLAMEELRCRGFYIQGDPPDGVMLVGWGCEGNIFNGYPKRGMKIHDFHPGKVIELFHRYALKGSDGGVLVYDDYDGESLYSAEYPHRMRQDDPIIHVADLVVIKEFFDSKNAWQTIRVMQQVSPKERPLDKHPAFTMKTNDFKEIQDFYNECTARVRQNNQGNCPLLREDHSNTLSNEEIKRIKDNDKKLVAQMVAKHDVLKFHKECLQKINESEREVTSENPDASSTGTEREQNLNTAGSPEKLTSKNAETSRRNMGEPYVNQFPTCTEPYVLLELSPGFDQGCLHKESGGVPFEEVKQRLFRDGDPIYIECVSPGDDVVTGELRFTPDADEYCPIMITFLKNNYIRPPQFFDLVIDPKDDTSKGISVTEEPLTKNIALYLPLINESSSLMFQG